MVMAYTRVIAYRLQSHVFADAVRIVHNIIAHSKIGIRKDLFLCRFLRLGTPHAPRARLLRPAFAEGKKHEFRIDYFKARPRKRCYHGDTTRDLGYIIDPRNKNAADPALHEDIACICRLGFT